MTITRAFAILAPVPEVHLVAGQETCEQQGKVAFGSRAARLFHKLDQARLDDEIRVFIFAMLPEKPIHPMVEWEGVYIRHVKASQNGRHPAGDRFRPPTITDAGELPGFWSIFWEVRALERVDPFPIHHLQPFDMPQPYSRQFIPKVPSLIEYPQLKQASLARVPWLGAADLQGLLPQSVK